MNEMYQLLDDLNVARCRMEDVNDDSIIGQLNRESYERIKADVEGKGRLLFGDDELSWEDIQTRVLTHLADKAKAFLGQNVDNMVESIANLDEDTSSALIRMESVLLSKKDTQSGFGYSNLFRVDLQFLRQFSPDEIEKFEALSSVLAGTNENTSVKGTSK